MGHRLRKTVMFFRDDSFKSRLRGFQIQDRLIPALVRPYLKPLHVEGLRSAKRAALYAARK